MPHCDGLGTRHSAMAAKACSTCHAVLLLQLISRANGAAGGIAAALVLMQATRLLPGPTQSAAEPTTGTTAAAASADTDANGRVCGVGGVGPCPLLRAATQGDIGARAAANGAPRGSSRRAWAADMPHSTHGLGTRHASRLWQRRPAVPAMRCWPRSLSAATQGDIGARAACWCAPIAYTACITCSEELVTGMGC